MQVVTSEGFCTTERQALDLEDVEVDFRLSVLKRYRLNSTSTKGAEVIMKGCKKSGILGRVRRRLYIRFPR